MYVLAHILMYVCVCECLCLSLAANSLTQDNTYVILSKFRAEVRTREEGGSPRREGDGRGRSGFLL